MPEFLDGQRGAAVTGGGVPGDQVIVEIDYGVGVGSPEHYVTRPSAEVIGWRVCCECSGRRGVGWASSDLIVRVPSTVLEDLAQLRVYAGDDDVPYVGDRPDVEDAARALWVRQHAGAANALRSIREAAQAVSEAQRELDLAVRHGRDTGASWEEIGRATGMARQSAHQRWGNR